MTIEVPNVPRAVLLDHGSHAESSASMHAPRARFAKPTQRWPILSKRATALQATERGITFQQAFARVYAQHPELAGRELAERPS